MCILSRIHDDCIENDYMHNGLVEDSLLDGCYVAFSARNSDGTDGHLNTETIRSSLVRLQPMPTVYKGDAPGHGGFFKWPTSTADGVGPNLVIENTIFRVDQLPNHGSLGLPEPPVGLTCAEQRDRVARRRSLPGAAALLFLDHDRCCGLG